MIEAVHSFAGMASSGYIMARVFHDWLLEQHTRPDTVGWVVRLLSDHSHESPLLRHLRDAQDIDDVFEAIACLDRGKIKTSLLQAYEEFYDKGV